MTTATPPDPLRDAIAKVEKERKEFANQASFDTLSAKLPDRIIGRQNEIEQLVGYLWGYHDGYVVPLVSVYGRSGTGKSTLVRYVCKNTPDVKMCYANLRKAKTVFGCANLILNALDQPSLKSAQGLNAAMEKIQQSVIDSMGFNKLFVLVLDEFDVLFYDRRNNPSDFVYKLIEMQSELLEKRCLSMIVTISNNVLADYELDDRIRSRIGNSEIFFKPYSESDVLKILEQRAQEAFGKKIPNTVLKRCALLSYLEHGDARRAVDLLRVAVEVAAKKNRDITIKDIDLASERLQKDRVNDVLSTLSAHSKIACMAIAIKTYGLDKAWHKTSVLYEKYKELLGKARPVTYRRFSELLTDLKNTGILDSNTNSKGRQGYSSEFMLLVQPEIVGKIIDGKFWTETIEPKKNQSDFMQFGNMSRSDPFYKIYKDALKANKDSW